MQPIILCIKICLVFVRRDAQVFFTMYERSWSALGHLVLDFYMLCFKIRIWLSLKFEFELSWNSNLIKFEFDVLWNSNFNFFQIRIWSQAVLYFYHEMMNETTSRCGHQETQNSWRCRGKGRTNTIRSELKGGHGSTVWDAYRKKFPMIQQTLQSIYF